MRKRAALQEIAESAAFWEQVFNEEALRCSDSNFVYANPWFPVEFARRVRELAELALDANRE
jgi:hypothetical protein